MKKLFQEIYARELAKSPAQLRRESREIAICLVLILLALLLAACQPDENTVPAVVLAAEAQARRDSTTAARLDSTARVYRDLGQAYEDSATSYHARSTYVQATATDTAALRSFFADYSK